MRSPGAAPILKLGGHIVDSLGTEPPVLAPGEGKVLYDDYGQVSSVHVNTGEAMLRALITRIWYGVDPTTGQRAPYLYEARIKDQFDEDSRGGFRHDRVEFAREVLLLELGSSARVRACGNRPRRFCAATRWIC